MLDNSSDKEIMELVQAGNHHAFGVLLNRYTGYFYRISYRYVFDKGAAEDIVQQAFLKLWEFPFKYNPDAASFKVWFCRVVINLSIDFLRKKKPIYNLDDYEIADGDENAETKLSKEVQEKKLKYFISKLPARQRTALNLVVYEDMSYEEAGVVMKLKLGAVKSLVMRAKENLKRYMMEEKNV